MADSEMEWHDLPSLSDEQLAASSRGEPVEIVPAPGPGKRIVLDESNTRYRIEEVKKYWNAQGERNHNATLTAHQVREIRTLHAERIPHNPARRLWTITELANRFSTSRDVIWKVVTRRTYTNV